MRRFLLIACAGIAVLAVSATAFAGKPATFKAGAYNGKTSFSPFTVTLKRGTCKVSTGQKKSSLKLCVSLTKAPPFECHTPTNIEAMVSAFATPVQLPSSGKLTEKAPLSVSGLPGEAPWAGEATFSVALKKNGTATGTFGLSITETFGGSSAVCALSQTFPAKVR